MIVMENLGAVAQHCLFSLLCHGALPCFSAVAGRQGHVTECCPYECGQSDKHQCQDWSSLPSVTLFLLLPSSFCQPRVKALDDFKALEDGRGINWIENGSLLI